jgi:hypothetical protein
MFSLFGFISTIFFIPIKEWQDIIIKYLKKPVRTAIIAVLIAFLIAQFPFLEVIAGYNNLKYNPEISENSSIEYKEESSTTSTDFFNINSYISSTSENRTSSNKQSNTITSKPVNSVQNNTTSNTTTHQNSYNYSYNSNNLTTSEDLKVSQNVPNSSVETNSNTVYRTPSGKKYHLSSTCGGKNSYEVSYDDAINSGLAPCKKCVK